MAPGDGAMMEKETLVALGAATYAALVIWRAKIRRSRPQTSWVKSESWAVKRAAFAKTATADNLLIITDFDATVTTGDSEQCHDVMGNSKVLDPAFRKEFAPLLDWEQNAAIDGVEWWDVAHGLMIKHSMPPRHIIPRLVREARMICRPGSLELLKRCEQLNVPVLVVSAGLSDVIEEFLRQHGALSENVTICSNRLNYEADSTPKSVSPAQPITSFTKATAYQSASSFFAEHAARNCIVQLGDSLTDVDPAKNVPYEHLLSIGFVNERPDPTKHHATFDATVHGSTGSLLPVMELLEEIAPPRTLMRQISEASLSTLGLHKNKIAAPAPASAAA